MGGKYTFFSPILPNFITLNTCLFSVPYLLLYWSHSFIPKAILEQIRQVFSSSNRSLFFSVTYAFCEVSDVQANILLHIVSLGRPVFCLLQFSLQMSMLSSKFVNPHYAPSMNYKTRVPT